MSRHFLLPALLISMLLSACGGSGSSSDTTTSATSGSSTTPSTPTPSGAPTPESGGKAISSTYNDFHYNTQTNTPAIATLVDNGLGKAGIMTLSGTNISFTPDANGDGGIAWSTPYVAGNAFNQSSVDGDLPAVAMLCQSIAGTGSNGHKSTDVLVTSAATTITNATALAGLSFTTYYEDCYQDDSSTPLTAHQSITFDASGNATIAYASTYGGGSASISAGAMTSMLSGTPNTSLTSGGNTWFQAYSYTSNGQTKYALVLHLTAISDATKGVAAVYLK